MNRSTAGFEADDADQRHNEAARHLPGDDGEDLLLRRTAGHQGSDLPERRLLVCNHLQPLARVHQVFLGALALGDVADSR